jgi:hypothetical protein
VLAFDPALAALPGGGQLRDGLSAAAAVGRTLWVVNDETLTVERLVRLPGAGVRYGEHRQYALADFLELHAGHRGPSFAEGDIEGLDVRDGFLWITGSHSLKRSAPDGKPAAKGLARLARTDHDGNQFLVGRIPLAVEDGLHTLVAAVGAGRERRVAAQLPGDDTSNLITEALAEDDHLWPFVAIPGKENGLDIEGIAVGAGGRTFLGLRGPVLRGWAVVVEVVIGADARRPNRLALTRMDAANRANRRHPTYRKHFLDLDGLGIRDLRVRGADLLILAGPTMALDGPFALYRWRGGARPKGEALVAGRTLERLFDLPSSPGGDHAEGLTLLPAARGEPDRLLVVYERASRRRHRGASGALADVYTLPR